MTMDSKLVASIASQIKLSEPVALYVIQGVSVKVDLHAGVVTIPEEQRVGVTMVSYSKEIQQVYRAPVEAALVMKMQMELLKGLSAIDDAELQKFLKAHYPKSEAPTPELVQSAVLKLVNWVKPPALNMFTLFQPAPQSPVKAALHEVFESQAMDDLKSLTTVRTLLENIEASLNNAVLRLGG
jgi:hypothetical protein